MDRTEKSTVQGHIDGYREGSIVGWAWRPGAPHEAVTVEVLVDGAVVADAVAWRHRADLRQAGIGDGRYGFAIPVQLDVDRLGRSRIMVRAKDGDPLPGSKLLIDPGGEVMDEVNDPAIAAFIDSVLNQTPSGRITAVVTPTGTDQAPAFHARRGAANHFIVHSASTETSLAKDIGDPEHDYQFVARTFNALWARFGTVHVASDPVDDVNRIYDECVARGDNCLFVYYALPHHMMLGSRCPTIPVIVWGYSNIPTETWGEEPRNDWRTVLRRTAGAITLSQHAAVALRAAMGDRYPVLSVPAPVWNRSQREGSKTPVRAVVSPAEVEIEGFVFDSRGGTFRMDESPSQPPRAAAGTVAIARGRLDGVVFTAVFAPRGARENSQNMLTAFLSAFSDTPDATLVFKIVGRDSYWWWETHDLLARMPASRCRVVVLQGLLSDQQYSSLIGASHWVLNGSAAEGVCLPLLEFMSAGRPAVAPAHTAMADYLNPGNSLIVRSDEDYCTWPQDTGCRFACDCFRIEWESLRDSMREAYRITRFDPQRYDSMCDAALATMSRCCTDTLVAERIAEFLGIGAAAA